MTTRDDTLWKIAARSLPADGISVNQQMLAIQRLNRQAFIRDNINLLKAGFVLRLPDESEAHLGAGGLAVRDAVGVAANPFARSLRVTGSTAVNYMMFCTRAN